MAFLSLNCVALLCVELYIPSPIYTSHVPTHINQQAALSTVQELSQPSHNKQQQQQRQLQQLTVFSGVHGQYCCEITSHIIADFLLCANTAASSDSLAENNREQWWNWFVL